jgi:hypothetical protein
LPEPVIDLYGADGTGGGYCGSEVEEGGVVGAILAVTQRFQQYKRPLDFNLKWPSYFDGFGW